MKEILREGYGLVGGGSDFTNIGEELFWILTYGELKKFRSLTPKWSLENTDER